MNSTRQPDNVSRRTLLRTALGAAAFTGAAPYVVKAQTPETLIVNTQGGEYQEIVEAERLVNTEVFEGAPPEAGAALNTNTFEAPEGGRTRLTMVTSVDSTEIRDMIVGTGMESGAQEGLDIIDEIVAELTAGGRASAAT